MDSAVKKYHIALPDRQLACAPVDSPEAGATSARCGARSITPSPTGRSSPTTRARPRKALGMSAMQIGLRTVYEVATTLPSLRRTASMAASGGCASIARRRAPLHPAARSPARIPRDRPARAHPWRYGPLLICAYRQRESNARHLRQHLPRRRARDEPRRQTGAAGRNIIREMEERDHSAGPKPLHRG